MAWVVELSGPDFIFSRHLDCYMKYSGQLVCCATEILSAVGKSGQMLEKWSDDPRDKILC